MDVPSQANTSNRIDVVIPALNEEASLPLVLRDLPSVRRVIVVDNGSTDQTAEVARRSGAVLIHQPKRGYGSACLAGLAEIQHRVLSGGEPPDIVVFLDADYSDHPNELHKLTHLIENDSADFVLGSRLMGVREPGAMPPQSVYGNKLACWLMRLLFGVRYTDLGPFRAITYRKLVLLGMSDENFGWTIEMQIKAAKAKLRIEEVPVSYRKRIGASKISGTVSGTIKAGSKILFTIAKYGLRFDQTRNDKTPVNAEYREEPDTIVEADTIAIVDAETIAGGATPEFTQGDDSAARVNSDAPTKRATA